MLQKYKDISVGDQLNQHWLNTFGKDLKVKDAIYI